MQLLMTHLTAQLLRRERRFDGGHDCRIIDLGLDAHDRLAIAADEEVPEIPFNVARKDPLVSGERL